MRFKQYLLEQDKFNYPHISPTSKEVACEWIKKHARIHLIGLKRGETPIWRGLSFGREDHAYGVGDSNKFVRKAANTFNYINLIVSNSTKWKDYPKRESAYICTTDFHNAVNFGAPYLVIPADNANVGIVPTFDFWYGFKEMDRMFQGGGVETMNEIVATICVRAKTPLTNEIGYDDLRKTLSNISREDLEEMSGAHPNTGDGFRDLSHKIEVDFHNSYSKKIQMIADKMSKGETLYSFLENILDPKESGLKHTMGHTINVDGSHELWIGGECAFISALEISGDEEGFNDIESKLKEWLNEI